MENSQIPHVIRRIKKAVKTWRTPIVTQISRKRDPFKVLIGCILSLRTRDEVTEAASKRLFVLAATPGKLLKLDTEKIEEAIYPSAFYRNKAKSIKEMCRVLIDEYKGKVPDALEELLKLKGVGRKTANLTLTLGYGELGICVDTHVHRISNRWGYVDTKTPDETEMALREKLSKKYWVEYNDLLVTFGQNVCRPISPFCTECCVSGFCEKVGVEKHR